MYVSFCNDIVYLVKIYMCVSWGSVGVMVVACSVGKPETGYDFEI